MFQRKKSTSPYTLKLHYHLNLVLKSCHCIATVLCFVYLAIMYCIVFVFVYMLVVMGGTMAQNFFKPEKNLDFFRLKICAIDATPGKLE